MSKGAPATRVVDLESVGRLVIEVVEDRLWAVRFSDGVGEDAGASDVADRVVRWFAGYESGAPAPIDVPLAERGTPFQRDVWAALQTIPWGQTWSYAQLAAAVGRPKGAQAVGAANGANPWSVLVPCHRVVGSDGRLVGYAGGLDRKRRLLAHEGTGSGMLF
ncbi:MAG: methylated-DNA--[protein]-cysteine S-methyltransferase [Myxococcota bacterium]